MADFNKNWPSSLICSCLDIPFPPSFYKSQVYNASQKSAATNNFSTEVDYKIYWKEESLKEQMDALMRKNGGCAKVRTVRALDTGTRADRFFKFS